MSERRACVFAVFITHRLASACHRANIQRIRVIRLLAAAATAACLAYLPEKYPIEVRCEVHVRSQGKASNIASQIGIRLVRNLQVRCAGQVRRVSGCYCAAPLPLSFWR